MVRNLYKNYSPFVQGVSELDVAGLCPFPTLVPDADEKPREDTTSDFELVVRSLTASVVPKSPLKAGGSKECGLSVPSPAQAKGLTGERPATAAAG